MNTKFGKIHNLRKVLLIVRDGWGYSPEIEYNMIAQADTPYTDYLEKTYPTTYLKASGESVGLPEGYMGNSEVGHMTMGVGRAIEQSFLRINRAIDDASFFENQAIKNAFSYAKKHHTKIHLMGLLQKEGVHAHFNHLIAFLEIAKQEGFTYDDVFIHIITDGRDAPEQHAIHYLCELEEKIQKIGVGKIVSLAGRYFAMDRNKNWERTEKYYQALMKQGEQDIFSSPEDFLLEKYKDKDFSDEFLKPALVFDYKGLQENDVLIDFSFRKDRERQITKVFCEKDFKHFHIFHHNIYYLAMIEYYKGLDHVVFPDIIPHSVLGELLEKAKKTQLRISETEKYAHVTFFFDGGVDYNFQGEKKIIIPSPNVSTFDLQPEMSSEKITEKLIFEIENSRQDFILCNFPNADMVGHTGELAATKEAIEAIDASIAKIIPAALEQGYDILLTGDHGNAEYKHNNYTTSHTLNPVPTTFISNKKDFSEILFEEGLSLENIASTILYLLQINIPKEYKKPLF